jgi:hypothetical protein
LNFSKVPLGSKHKLNITVEWIFNPKEKMMKNLLLSIKRPFNVKAYLVLAGLLFLAAFAIQPYSMTTTGTQYLNFWYLLLSVSINFLIYAVLGAVGLWLASRIGLGMPFIEGWTKREPTWNRLPGVVGMAVLAGVLLNLVKAIDLMVAPWMMHLAGMPAESSAANTVAVPVWQGVLAAFSAGITEETIYRLFGLTLLAWLGCLLFCRRAGRPAIWLLWTANILFALFFGLAHLPAASQRGILLDLAVVTRTLILNGVGGVVFGWLYWSYGLESAMLAHISADMILYGLVPLVTQQADPARSLMVGALVGLVIILAILWSIRAVLADRKQFPPSSVSDAPSMEADYSLPTS